MKYLECLVLFYCALFCVSAHAQDLFTVDLSKSHDPITQPVVPGTYTVEILNRIPNDTFEYTIFVEIKTEPIPALEWPGATIKKPTPPAVLTGDVCTGAQKAFIDAYNVLAEAKEESKVPKQIQTLQQAMKAIEDLPGCGYPISKLTKADAEALLDRTHRTLGPYPLRQGERLEVTVTRQRTDGSTEETLPTWKYVFTTGSRGHWLTSFGFAAIPNWFSEDELFFSKAVTDSTFVIASEENRNELDAVPAIFFSWLPRKWESSNFAGSFTGGLGLDLSNPVIFFGVMGTYNQNISLNAGLVVHQQQRLLGKYKGDGTDVLKDALEQNQLHEKLYGVNLYIALTFRFNNNIFATSSEE